MPAPAPVHQGDLVTVRGRVGVWRVAWVRRGAARVTAVTGTAGVASTTVPVDRLDPAVGVEDDPG